MAPSHGDRKKKGKEPPTRGYARISRSCQTRPPSPSGPVRRDATRSRVWIYDTTLRLRDGTQMESISVSCDNKI